MVVLGLLVVYVCTFSYWWLRTPVTSKTTASGRQIQVVRFQFNKVSYRTQPLWLPAFWFMEHVCGYQEMGMVAMYDDSILVFQK